jgi:hypothetical protein
MTFRADHSISDISSFSLNEAPKSVREAIASRTDTEKSTSAEPQIDLGAGLEATTPGPGRFANVIQRNTYAKHAFQVIRVDMTSSFVLKLEPNGSATVCRGWRYLFFNDGPKVHTEERIREQLGYRGSWEKRDGWVHLHITLDDSVCPRIGQYSHLVPNHSLEWHLSCLPIMPRDHPALVTPILACKSTNLESEFGEEGPHIVPGLIPGRWIVLGTGNGLRITVEVTSVKSEEPSAIQVAPSPEPIRADAWERSF